MTIDAPPPDDDRGPGVKGTQTLDRGLDLLELAVNQSATIPDLVRRSGLSRNTTYRLTGALIARDFLAWTKDGRLCGGSRLIRLGLLAHDQIDLVGLVRPHLRALSADTGLCAFLGRRDGDHSVHLLRTQGNERVAVATQPGSRRLLGQTGLGKALLLDEDGDGLAAHAALLEPPHLTDDWVTAMQRAAAVGVVLQFGPPPDSIHSVAAPVRDASGRIAAAINLAAAAQYLGPDRMAELAPQVRATAAAIGRDLGWRDR